MTHEEARDLLTDRLLDELSSDEGRRLEAHLRDCPDCGETARRWTTSWEALGALELAPVDPAAHVRFGRRLEQEVSRGWGMPGARMPLVALAAVALLLAGGIAGQALAPGPAADGGRPGAQVAGPQVMLVLRGEEPDRRQAADVLVAEYGVWAGTLAAAGSLVAAEQLDAESGRWVAPDSESDPASTPISGFFIVRAPSYDSALVIARESPHAGYGGVIEVRRVVEGR